MSYVKRLPLREKRPVPSTGVELGGATFKPLRYVINSNVLCASEQSAAPKSNAETIKLS